MPAATTRRAAVPARRAASSGNQRITTGIPGLDQLIQGGFVRNSVNLVTGGTGTGKTIFAGQFLWEGLQKGEPCVYITMEQHPDDLKQDFLQFGWNFDKYEKQGLCSIEYFDPAQVNNIASAILNSVKTLGAKRLAVDSTSVVGLTIENEMMIRRKLLSLIDAVKRQSGDCTTLLTTEIEEGSEGLSRWGVEEFVVDGVVHCKMVTVGRDTERTLQIRKMRRTSHKTGFCSMEITNKGVKVTA
jgi:KaiC/GvpD/RAD55 family RecA-like ATPase